MKPSFVQQSPSRRAWLRFRKHRMGFFSLVAFVVLFVMSLGAEFLSNDRPLLVRYDGRWYSPVVQDLPETVFGGILRPRPITWTPSFLNA